MAYEKQTWQTGDVITQEKLNHMEQGIEDAYELPAVTETDNGKVLGVENGQFGLVDGGSGGGTLVVNINETGDVYTLDKTWQEIFDAYLMRGAVIKEANASSFALRPISQIRSNPDSSAYMVEVMGDEYTTESPNGYPANGGVI